MARFIGNIQGCRGPVSRLGGEKSGITVSAGGWTVGIEVRGYVDDAGKDRFDVYLNAGSNGDLPRKKIGSFSRSDVEK